MSVRCQFKLQGRHARCWLGAPRCPPPKGTRHPWNPGNVPRRAPVQPTFAYSSSYAFVFLASCSLTISISILTVKGSLSRLTTRK
jgi:hypothetical protein